MRALHGFAFLCILVAIITMAATTSSHAWQPIIHWSHNVWVPVENATANSTGVIAFRQKVDLSSAHVSVTLGLFFVAGCGLITHGVAFGIWSSDRTAGFLPTRDTLRWLDQIISVPTLVCSVALVAGVLEAWLVVDIILVRQVVVALHWYAESAVPRRRHQLTAMAVALYFDLTGVWYPILKSMYMGGSFATAYMLLVWGALIMFHTFEVVAVAIAKKNPLRQCRTEVSFVAWSLTMKVFVMAVVHVLPRIGISDDTFIIPPVDPLAKYGVLIGVPCMGLAIWLVFQCLLGRVAWPPVRDSDLETSLTSNGTHIAGVAFGEEGCSGDEEGLVADA